MDKKASIGTVLIGTALSLATVFAIVYVAGKAWKKGTGN